MLEFHGYLLLPIAIKIPSHRIKPAVVQIPERFAVVRTYSEYLFLEIRSDRPNLYLPSVPFKNRKLVLAIAI